MKETVKRPVILDTDPGVDDAVAMLLLLGSEQVDLQAITVVGGNVGLKSTLRNALCLTELAGRTDVPVYAGAASPLMVRLVTAPDVHGAGGLGSLSLPDPVTKPAAGEVSELFYRRALERPGELTILAIGPLTNVAKAFLAHPDLPGLLREVIVMGGGILGGNATLQAEFNIYVDPEAARIVFESGVKLTMVPLDVCNQTTLGSGEIEQLEAVGTACADAVASLLRYSHAISTRMGLKGCPVYDAVTAAYLLRPDLFSCGDFVVAIETRGVKTRGKTVVDWYGVSRRAANCTIPLSCNAAGYLSLLLDRLSRLP